MTKLLKTITIIVVFWAVISIGVDLLYTAGLIIVVSFPSALLIVMISKCLHYILPNYKKGGRGEKKILL